MIEEDVQREIVRTNALITDEQFGRLRAAIGTRVSMIYNVINWPSDDEARKSTEAKGFTLLGFNYVVDPKTESKYLAFLRYGPGRYDYYFPFYQKSNAFHDITTVTIEDVLGSGAVRLWSFNMWLFDRLGQSINFSDSVNEHVQQIANASIRFPP